MIFNYARERQQSYRAPINLDEYVMSSSYQIRKKDLNATEGKFYEVTKALSLDLKAQYRISRMHVDFASPAHNAVIEINGPHHDLAHYRAIDRRRKHVLNQLGWAVYSFTAEQAYDKPYEVARTIEEILAKRKQHIKTFIDTSA